MRITRRPFISLLTRVTMFHQTFPDFRAELLNGEPLCQNVCRLNTSGKKARITKTERTLQVTVVFVIKYAF